LFISSEYVGGFCDVLHSPHFEEFLLVCIIPLNAAVHQIVRYKFYVERLFFEIFVVDILQNLLDLLLRLIDVFLGIAYFALFEVDRSTQN
jgi:hypothetical protein